MSFRQQCDFLQGLRARTTGRGGAQSSEAWLLLEPSDVVELDKIIARLNRMAPHEDAIKRVVTGK